MVPEGWELRAIGRDLKVQGGFAFKSEEFSDSGIPIARISSIKEPSVFLEDAPCYTEDKRLARFLLKDGDILIAMSGATTGKTGRFFSTKKHPHAYLNQRVGRFILNGGNLDEEFLWHLVSTDRFRNLVSIEAIGGAQPNVSGSEIETLAFAIPPLPEQQKIAEILSTWDRAIETAEVLLATARTQKRALMQTLLTGKRRFPEFEGEEWRKVRLGNIVEITAGKTKSDVLDEDGEKVVLDMGAVSRLGVIIPKKRTRATDDILEVGDLVMPKDDIGGGNIIGKVVLVSKEGAYVLGDHVYRLRIKLEQQAIPAFLRFVINGSEVNRWFRRKANGTAQLGLNRKDVEKQVIELPSMREQSQIANLLSDADDLEGEYLSQIKRLHTEKKALMQQLLTGKRRVQV